MEEEIYLTPNLIIMDMKSYYINDDTNKLEKINVKNWHKYYSDYGWNPYQITGIDELKNELVKGGDNFWGDHIIIQLLGEALNVNFIILNSEKIGGDNCRSLPISPERKYKN